MLYLFYGTDRNKALSQALKIIEKKLSEKKDAVVFKVDAENISNELLMELSGGQGLFEQKFIVHVKDIFQDENTKTIFTNFLKDVSESENIFILTEGSLTKKDLTKIEKYTEKVWEHTAQEKVQTKENIFNITNYLLTRDKKNLWIQYHSLKENFVPEEIHGTLFWAFKNIVLASKSKTSEDAGLKSFVYSSAKKAGTKFSPEELEEKFWTLTKMLSDSRRGEGDLDVLLEKWILTI